jgi:hypothetical protein
MKTHTITTYSFSELSEQAKETAINKFRDINTDFGWWDFIYEDASEIGLKITGFDLDRYRHATGKFTLSAVEVAQNILNNHGEQCGTHKLAEKFLSSHGPIFAEYMDEDSEKYESAETEEELMELEDEFLSDLLEEYSLMLQTEFEYLESDEAIIQTIEANEYEFTENGNIY